MRSGPSLLLAALLTACDALWPSPRTAWPDGDAVDDPQALVGLWYECQDLASEGAPGDLSCDLLENDAMVLHADGRFASGGTVDGRPFDPAKPVPYCPDRQAHWTVASGRWLVLAGGPDTRWRIGRLPSGLIVIDHDDGRRRAWRQVAMTEAVCPDPLRTPNGLD